MIYFGIRKNHLNSKKMKKDEKVDRTLYIHGDIITMYSMKAWPQ